VRRHALLKELRAPPPTFIPIPYAVRTLDFVKVCRRFLVLSHFLADVNEISIGRF
jgi:hypothetical protein